MVNEVLHILVDEEEFPIKQVPTDSAHLPDSSPVVFSDANPPAECRPFGGDRARAAQSVDIMTDQGRLHLDAASFTECLLLPDDLAAPTWFAKFR